VANDELPEDWWTTNDVAAYLGISQSTIRSYVARQQMPAPDRHIGRTAVWKPDTIRTWHEDRPRVGGGEA